MKITTVMTILYAEFMFCGCDVHSEKSSMRNDDVAAMCRGFLSSDQGSAMRRAEMHEEMQKRLRKESGLHCDNAELKLIGVELLKTDLSLHDKDYRDMSRRVSSYEDCFECYESYLFDSTLERKYVLDSFFECMLKLRKACFSVSHLNRMPEESSKEFEERCYAVWDMMETYGHAMRLWELRMNQHLLRLPASMRDEYLERRKPFLDYLKGRKLRESMLFGNATENEVRGKGK